MRLFKMSLTLQMGIATALGILCGLFLGDLCEVFAPYTSAYVMILKITAVPYLIGAIIHGVGQLGKTQALQILKRGLGFLCLAWAINVVVIYGIVNLFPRPKAAQFGGYFSSEVPQLNFAELLIPENIFHALTANIVPAIVVFSLLIGIALMLIKEKDVFLRGMGNLVEALTRITSWIARITPFGTFLIIAYQVGTLQISTAKQMTTYVILYVIGVLVIVFWIFPQLVSMLTSIPAYRWIQQIFPILLLAYTTNFVIVCLPYIIELLKKETQILDPNDEKAQSQIQGTVSVVFNLPLGSLFITVFVFFISIFYNVPVLGGSQIKLFVTTFLTSLGAVGLGSWINTLTFLLDSLGLPMESIQLYLATLPFTAGFQSMISVIEIASISLFITLSCRKMLSVHWIRILKKGLIAIIPLIAAFICIKAYNPLPEIKNEIKSIYELNISSSIPVKIYKTLPEPSPGGEDTLDRILASKTIRVGYNPQFAPFCFLNVDDNIVGYDVAFAYELAYDLGCQLDLVPLQYDKLISELDGRYYDIAMSAVTVNERRLMEMTFAEPYISPRLVLVVQEKMRRSFSNIDKVIESKKYKIAVLKGSSYEAYAKEIFPHKEIIYLDCYDQLEDCDSHVALLWEEVEASAWTLTHRKFRILFYEQPLGFDTLAYAIKNNNERFLNYLNRWLELKKSEGFTEKQHDLWVKGRTEIAAMPEPRWSIIRNVLHWID